MRVLQKILFTFALIVGMSLVVSAQKGEKKTPPKQEPPVINPGKQKPKNDDKPKKQSAQAIIASKESPVVTV